VPAFCFLLEAKARTLLTGLGRADLLKSSVLIRAGLFTIGEMIYESDKHRDRSTPPGSKS
jgi:hypothetical protein